MILSISHDDTRTTFMGINDFQLHDDGKIELYAPINTQLDTTMSLPGPSKIEEDRRLSTTGTIASGVSLASNHQIWELKEHIGNSAVTDNQHLITITSNTFPTLQKAITDMETSDDLEENFTIL